MQKVFSNDMVKHVWAQQSQECGYTQSRNFSFSGGELVSYNTTIALHYGDFVLCSSDTFSQTTASKHMPAPYDVTAPFFYVDDLFQHGERFYSRRDYPMGGKIKNAILRKLLGLSRSYMRRRTDSTRSRDLDGIKTNLEALSFICDRFGLIYPKGYTDTQEVLGTTGKVAKKLEAKARREKAALNHKHAQQLKADKAQFEAWLAGELVEIPYSYARKAFYLTVRGDMVYTSGGAQAPIEHVRKAFNLYHRTTQAGVDSRWSRNGERCQLGYFQLDSIDRQGNARAGCHVFLKAELLRFEERWL